MSAFVEVISMRGAVMVTAPEGGTLEARQSAG